MKSNIPLSIRVLSGSSQLLDSVSIIFESAVVNGAVVTVVVAAVSVVVTGGVVETLVVVVDIVIDEVVVILDISVGLLMAVVEVVVTIVGALFVIVKAAEMRAGFGKEGKTIDGLTVVAVVDPSFALSGPASLLVDMILAYNSLDRQIEFS